MPADALRTIPVLEPYAATFALGTVVLVISYVSLILGELVPKRVALQNPEAIAIRLAPLMHGLGRFTGPMVRFLTFSSELVLRLIGRHNLEETPITEDDVMALVREGTAEGTLETAEADLISSVFAFTERTVRSLMTPRTQMVAVEVTRPLADVIGIVTESGYSRIPVFQETLDTVIGIVYVRDLLRAVGQSPAPRASPTIACTSPTIACASPTIACTSPTIACASPTMGCLCATQHCLRISGTD